MFADFGGIVIGLKIPMHRGLKPPAWAAGVVELVAGGTHNTMSDRLQLVDATKD